ncbi:uncharacterized protein LOC135423210 [Pseudopipra pipra]|uniref:uncharacterized protein LOC135423210 n=1 Tax=Pseudopipra pipra TaxID=415032 RepID=UPI0031387593
MNGLAGGDSPGADSTLSQLPACSCCLQLPLLGAWVGAWPWGGEVPDGGWSHLLLQARFFSSLVSSEAWRPPLGLLPRECGGWGVLPLSSSCGDLGAFHGAGSEGCGVEVSEQELERFKVCRCHCCCSQLSSRFALQRAAGSKAADHGSSQQCRCCPVHPEVRVKSGIHLQLSQCIHEVRVATGSSREEETGKRSALPLEAAGFELSPVTQFCS